MDEERYSITRPDERDERRRPDRMHKVGGNACKDEIAKGGLLIYKREWRWVLLASARSKMAFPHMLKINEYNLQAMLIHHPPFQKNG